MNIQWNTVTWYSKPLAVALFLFVFWIGFYFGVVYNKTTRADILVLDANTISTETQKGTTSFQEQNLQGSSGIKNDAMVIPLAIISPVTGERLCLGDTFFISWKADSSIATVSIMIVRSGTTYSVDEVPATYNETGDSGVGSYPWRVGTYGKTYSLSEGDALRVSLVGFDKKMQQVHNTPQLSPLFSIQDCHG